MGNNANKIVCDFEEPPELEELKTYDQPALNHLSKQDFIINPKPINDKCCIHHIRCDKLGIYGDYHGIEIGLILNRHGVKDPHFDYYQDEFRRLRVIHTLKRAGISDPKLEKEYNEFINNIKCPTAKDFEEKKRKIEEKIEQKKEEKILKEKNEAIEREREKRYVEENKELYKKRLERLKSKNVICKI